MRRYALPTLLAASLWATAFVPAQAQGTNPAPAKPAPTTTNPPAAASDPEVVASVNDKPITWTQLIERMRSKPKEFADAVGQVVGAQATDTLFGADQKTQVTITRDQVLTALRKDPPPVVRSTLDTMLVEEALKQEAAKEGVEPTDAQVNDRIAKLFANLHQNKTIPANMTDDQFLQSNGLTRAQFVESMRHSEEAMRLIQKDMETSLGHPVGPGDFVQARHILIQVPQASPTTKPEDQKKLDADKLAKADQIVADIKSGKKTFAQEAQENSDDPGSKAKGGELGVFARGMMVKEFETAAFSLKPGEVSKPVRSQFGYHIIEVEKLGKDIPADQRQQVWDQYMQQYMRVNSQVFLNKLMKEKVKIVNNLPPPPARPGGPGGTPGGGE